MKSIIPLVLVSVLAACSSNSGPNPEAVSTGFIQTLKVARAENRYLSFDKVDNVHCKEAGAEWACDVDLAFHSKQSGQSFAGKYQVKMANSDGKWNVTSWSHQSGDKVAGSGETGSNTTAGLAKIMAQ